MIQSDKGKGVGTMKTFAKKTGLFLFRVVILFVIFCLAYEKEWGEIATVFALLSVPRGSFGVVRVGDRVG